MSACGFQVAADLKKTNKKNYKFVQFDNKDSSNTNTNGTN